MESKLHRFIRDNSFDYPTLVLDLEPLKQNYDSFTENFTNCNVHYAVKANPHPSILKAISSYGGKFDAASAGEIQKCLDAGAKPADISFGNTIKSVSDIRFAHRVGIDLFAVDSSDEIDKVAEHAPGSRVFIRVIILDTEADWPLSRKFGCHRDMVIPLAERAKSKGLNPVGLSFHIGSQTKHPQMWTSTLDYISEIWKECREQGFDFHVLNIGGGFPSYYGVDITPASKYNKLLNTMIKKRFKGVDYLIVEPGRGMVANLGAIAADVLLVSQKSNNDSTKWVYLNIGRFSGLAETEQEAIKYQIAVIGKENEPVEGFILAGPTCDSADVLYEKHKILLPATIKTGDKVIINNTGAYTTTYSSVAFNGFPPLRVVEI
jgi:ornithine decarboxylase